MKLSLRNQMTSLLAAVSLVAIALLPSPALAVDYDSTTLSGGIPGGSCIGHGWSDADYYTTGSSHGTSITSGSGCIIRATDRALYSGGSWTWQSNTAWQTSNIFYANHTYTGARSWHYIADVGPTGIDSDNTYAVE